MTQIAPVDVKDFKELCRICLEKGVAETPLRSIYQYEDPHNTDVAMDLTNKIKAISNVHLDPADQLPDKICSKCTDLLSIGHYFKTLSERSDTRLRSVLNGTDISYGVIKLEKVEDTNDQLKLQDSLAKSIPNVLAEIKTEKCKLVNNNMCVDTSGKILKIGDCDVVVRKVEDVVIKKEPSNISDDLENNSLSIDKRSNNCKVEIPIDYKDNIINNKDDLDDVPMDNGNDANFDSDFSDSATKCVKEEFIEIRIRPLTKSEEAKRKTKKNNKCELQKLKKVHLKILPLPKGQIEKNTEEGFSDMNIEDDNTNFVKGIKGTIVNKKIHPLNPNEEPHVRSNVKKKDCLKSVKQVVDSTELIPENECNGCYECLICGIKYMHKTMLHQHMAFKHKHKKEFKCYGCDKKFKTPSERLVHEMKHCSSMQPNAEYRCRQCKLKFYKRSAYDIHMVQHNAGPTSNTLELENLLKCNSCSYTTTKKHLMTQHVTNYHTVDTNYVCETCGKHYTNANTFKSHKATHVPILRRLKCEYCEFTTPYHNTLKCHERTHTREYRYTCDECGKCFITNGAWQVHRKRHLGIREHQCTLCDKNYLRKNELQVHIEAVHEKIRPYKCTLCDSAFYQLGKCKKHMMQVHKITTPIDIPSIRKKRNIVKKKTESN